MARILAKWLRVNANHIEYRGEIVRFYNATNRVDDAIDRQRARIEKLVNAGVDLQGKPIGPSLEKMDAEMALTIGDHCQFQQHQAKAHAMQRINQDEAMSVYNALGEAYFPDNGGWQPGVDLATKVIVTQMISELI